MAPATGGAQQQRLAHLASSNFLPLHLFILAGVLYLVMSYPLSRAVGRLERRMGRGR